MGEHTSIHETFPARSVIERRSSPVRSREAARGGRRREDAVSAAILDASPYCVIAIGTDRRVVEWNRAAEQAFGYPRTRVLGRDVTELNIPPSIRDAYRDALASGIGNGNAPISGRRLERTMRANGEELPVELTVIRSDGADPLFVGFIRDLAEPDEQSEQAQTDARRRSALSELGYAVLAGTAVDQLIERIAELARAEVGMELREVWAPDADGEDLAPLGASTTATGSAMPPPIPEPEVATLEPGGDVFLRLPIQNAAPGVLVARLPKKRVLTDGDRDFIVSLCQLLGSGIGQRRSKDELAQAERRYRELIERLPVVSYLAEYGAEGRWLYVSPQIEALLGYPPEDWLEDRHLWWTLLHPDDRDRVAANEERCAAAAMAADGAGEESKALSVEYRMIARDGRVVWIRDQGSLGRPAGGDVVQVEGVLTDVTERKHAEQALRHQAEHDDLTGLPNRRRFADELSRRASEQSGGAVAILDVDSLKFVNDSLGHPAGDALLRSVAAALQARLGPDVLVARLGGDEFAVLLDGAPEEQLRARLDSLVLAVRTRDSSVPATVSVGAVRFDARTSPSGEDLLVAADIALHAAKERGGDRVSMFTEGSRERLAWVGHVRAAIDQGRFCLHAQPIVDLASDEAVSDELLVRMVDPDGQVLPPSAFLPTAERFGLIREIDSWVVEQAIGVAGGGRSVTINLSARSIADPELTQQISEALERSGADPETVVFEITETAAASAIGELRDFGARIERLGCALAIDDFGTGFGSLTYLKHLPIRYLKIDMEFVGGLTESAADRAIVKSIVTIARSLGMRTVAEGVEDSATLEHVRSLGVDYAQGYHLGRPAPLDL